jgi:hypothetical protein
MKKWVFIAVLLLLGGGIWVWMLGAPPEEKGSAVRVTAVQGTAEQKAPSAAEWLPLASGVTLPEGTSVRTGEGSRVTLAFGDQAESRIAANSEVVVTQATFDGDGQADAKVTVTVQKGRVWSRVLRLFDLDSGFTVKTNDVVATVRGTAFDVEKRVESDDSVLWVSQSAVEAGDEKAFSADAAPDRLVSEGYMRAFKKGVPQPKQPIPTDSFQGAWVKDMRALDAEFLAKSVRAPASGGTGMMASLTRWSQSMRMPFMKGQAKKDAMQKLMQDEWLATRDQAEQGNVGEATQAFSKTMEKAKAMVADKDQGTERMVRRALFRAWLSFDDVGPNDAPYRLKQKMEDAMGEQLAEDPTESAYFRLMVLDARVDEAIAALDRKELDTAQKTIELVQQGLVNVERDVKGMKDLTVAHRRALMAKDLAIHVRLEALQERKRAAMEKPVEPAPVLEVAPSSTAPIAPTSTTPSKPADKKPATPPAPVTTQTPTPAPTPTPPPSQPTAKACTGLKLSVQPATLEVKQTAALSAYATYDDGTGEDVTRLAAYRLLSGAGTLAGSVFTATAAGTAQIEASMKCPANTVSASASVTVSAPAVTPTRFSMGAQPPTIGLGGTVTLTAAMQYSDNSSKTVTANTSFTSSDPNMGSVQGNVFTAGRKSGTVIVNAYHDEAGQSFSDSFTITVQGQTTTFTVPIQ